MQKKHFPTKLFIILKTILILLTFIFIMSKIIFPLYQPWFEIDCNRSHVTVEWTFLGKNFHLTKDSIIEKNFNELFIEKKKGFYTFSCIGVN